MISLRRRIKGLLIERSKVFGSTVWGREWWAVLGGSGWRERVESDWQIWALFQAVDKTQTSCAGKYEPFSGSAHARPVHAAAWAGHRTSDCKTPESALTGGLILTLLSRFAFTLRDIGWFFLDMCRRQYSGCSKITSSQKLGRSLDIQ